MELVAWELSLDLKESILIGIDKEDYKLEESYEIDYSLCFLCLRLRLTLIYS
tara:strand:+ start:629 stop:784 length:156 start_codon:yes stop_codon:yes gene_type:complete